MKHKTLSKVIDERENMLFEDLHWYILIAHFLISLCNMIVLFESYYNILIFSPYIALIRLEIYIKNTKTFLIFQAEI